MALPRLQKHPLADTPRPSPVGFRLPKYLKPLRFSIPQAGLRPPEPDALRRSSLGLAREGRRVHALAPRPRVLLEGNDATEVAVRAELPSAGCFPFAGHTHLLAHAPLRTALLCTPAVEHDGRLEVRALFGLN